MPSAMNLSPMPEPRGLSVAAKAAAATIGIIGTALAGVYVNEGGYVDNPHDRGGKTRYGVTEAVARKWGYTGPMSAFPKHCGPGVPVCSDIIYATDYIDKPGFRPMAAVEPAILYELVDSAVLHGQGRASGWFIGALNGVCRTKFRPAPMVIPAHVEAYEQCATNLGKVKVCVRMLDTMDGAQSRFFDQIVARNPSQRVFLKGWKRMRVGNVPRKACAS